MQWHVCVCVCVCAWKGGALKTSITVAAITVYRLGMGSGIEVHTQTHNHTSCLLDSCVAAELAAATGAPANVLFCILPTDSRKATLVNLHMYPQQEDDAAPKNTSVIESSYFVQCSSREVSMHTNNCSFACWSKLRGLMGMLVQRGWRGRAPTSSCHHHPPGCRCHQRGRRCQPHGCRRHPRGRRFHPHVCHFCLRPVHVGGWYLLLVSIESAFGGRPPCCCARPVITAVSGAVAEELNLPREIRGSEATTFPKAAQLL